MPKIDTAAPVAPTKETVKTPLDIAVDKVVAESDCTPAEAETMITDWLMPIVERSRRTGGTAYPSDSEMFVGGYGSTESTRSYAIFDQVMPHGEASAPGSAHEAIEKVVLDPSRDEYGLIHDQTGDRQRHCTVTTKIGTVSGLS